MPELPDRVVARYEFTCLDGTVLERDVSYREVVERGTNVLLEEVPPWLERAMKSWDHPQDPILFRGTVKPGHEADARRALGLEDPRHA